MLLGEQDLGIIADMRMRPFTFQLCDCMPSIHDLRRQKVALIDNSYILKHRMLAGARLSVLLWC